mmetsp:Transcript_10788/g.31941  ORF Transcript_10788/g.31941 Transcript_10788/m.31941 type:complete len:302 (+) Transcript_10788:861-1766(+)
MFLLGLPKNSWTQECTTFAIRLTKTMTWSCRTSVASVKFRMSQKPKMASTRRPGIMAFSAALSPPCMLRPMISAPASPNPRASSEPILMIVFSRTTVSMGSGTCFGPLFCVTHIAVSIHLRSFSMTVCWDVNFATIEAASSPSWRPWRFRMLALLTCSFWCSSSPMAMASSGLFLIRFSLVIMRSIGVSTSLFASREKVMAPKPSKKQMNKVCAVLSMASMREPCRRSKTMKKNISSHSSPVIFVGVSTVRSWYRRSSGQPRCRSAGVTKGTPWIVLLRHALVWCHGVCRAATPSEVNLHW